MTPRDSHFEIASKTRQHRQRQSSFPVIVVGKDTGSLINTTTDQSNANKCAPDTKQQRTAIKGVIPQQPTGVGMEQGSIPSVSGNGKGWADGKAIVVDGTNLAARNNALIIFAPTPASDDDLGARAHSLHRQVVLAPSIVPEWCNG